MDLKQSVDKINKYFDELTQDKFEELLVKYHMTDSDSVDSEKSGRTSSNINPFIMELMKDGVVIEMSINNAGELVYDLNTGMKSHCYAIDRGNGLLHLSGRYEFEEDYDTSGTTYIEFVSHIVSSCMHGCDYYNACWCNVMEKYILQKQ